MYLIQLASILLGDLYFVQNDILYHYITIEWKRKTKASIEFSHFY